MTPQELEQWVLAASDMSLDQQKRWDATNSLNAWVEQHTSDGVVSRSFLELVASTRDETVLFYALTTLQRLTLSLAERIELRNLFFLHQQNYCRASTFLKTKMAVVLALLVKKDYPINWTQALEEVLTKMNTEMSLRALFALFEDLVSHGDEDSARVKDAMRGYNDRNRGNIQGVTTPTTHLMEWLVGMLSSALQQHMGGSTNGTNEATACASLAFQVLKLLAGWIDISFVLNDTVLNLIFCGVELAEVSISLPAAETLRELVGRGMPAERKIDMLAQIDIFKRIHNSKVDLDTVDASPIEVVIEIAKLINMTGLELLPVWEDLQSSDRSSLPLNTLLQQLLELFFLCFAYDDIDVSGAVIALASRLTLTIDKEKGTIEDNASNGPVFYVTRRLPQLLTIMYRQMQYPTDFEFDFEDEDEAEEEVYRADLRKFNQAVVRICPEVCLQFICEALANLSVPISSCPTPDLEVALRLLYHYCEGIRPPPGMKHVMKNETFCALLVALHKSDITSHPHREVVLLYYDICVRYHPIFKKHPELLPNVLESISGVRGLQHANARVRSRSCYMLLRLVKSLASLLRPYVETAVSGILGLLSNPNTYPLRPDDTLYLFETIGMLLGKTGLDPPAQQRHLTEVMTPHVRSIKEIR